jgi:hypothetical protein
MAPKTVKAGPVAGTDLRNSDLTITSDNSHSTRALQVARLTRRCAISVAMASIIAPILHGEGEQR